MLKEVNHQDRRDLMIWGVDVKDPVFLEDYNTERAFWEAGGRKRGGMDETILYLLAKKHSKNLPKVEEVVEQKAPAPAKPKKDLQPA